MNDDLHRVSISGHHLVDTVIDNFSNQVVQAALVGCANVHAGAHADRFKSFENLNILLAIIAIAIPFILPLFPLPLPLLLLFPKLRSIVLSSAPVSSVIGSVIIDSFVFAIETVYSF